MNDNSIIEHNEIIPEGVKMIQAPYMWSQGYKGKGINIAVIDTGCDINHWDLKDRIVEYRNFTNEDKKDPNIVTDYMGHGTHVAGTIGASQNDYGIIGVAPECNLFIYKALLQYGGELSWVTEAIKYATSRHVDIINLSMGTSTNDPDLYNAIKEAVKNNILVVSSSGNSGDGSTLSSEIDFPAAYKEVISVGATDLNMKIPKFSSSNNQVNLVAPGQNIYSTHPGNTYKERRGTSQSAAFVSGALALIIESMRDKLKRNVSVVEVYTQLIKSTIPLGYDKKLEGNGFLYLSTDYILEQIVKNNELDKYTKEVISDG